MTVQAGAVRRLLRPGPGRGAGGRSREFDATSHKALTQMRSLVSVLLREQAEMPEFSPQPQLKNSEHAPPRPFRAAGLPVGLGVDGARKGPITSGSSLAAYHVVQEALANALKYGGAADASAAGVRWSDDEMKLESQTTETGRRRRRRRRPWARRRARARLAIRRGDRERSTLMAAVTSSVRELPC